MESERCLNIPLEPQLRGLVTPLSSSYLFRFSNVFSVRSNDDRIVTCKKAFGGAYFPLEAIVRGKAKARLFN